MKMETGRDWPESPVQADPLDEAPRRFLRRHLALAACVLAIPSLAAAAGLSGATARNSVRADDDSRPDLVFMTDDDAQRFDGCDAMSAYDASNHALIVRGEQHVSPGRLAATSDGRFAVSVSNNSGRFLYILAKSARSGAIWRTQRIDNNNLVEGGPVAISPDDRYLLLPRGGNRLAAYDLVAMRAVVDGGQVPNLANPLATASVRGVAALSFSPDAGVVYAVGLDRNVYALRLPDLAPVADPLPVQTANGTTERLIRNTNLSVSPDGRYLAINRLNAPGIILVDLPTRNATVVDTPDLVESWGLAFNHAAPNRGVLAIHGRARVGVYAVDAGPTLRLIVAADVPAPDLSNWVFRLGNQVFDQRTFARLAALAWSRSGDRLFVGVSRKQEFRVLDFTGDPAPSLLTDKDLDACTNPEGLKIQLDVVGLNDKLPLIDVSPTPGPTVTETATQTADPPTAPPTPSPTQTMPPRPTATVAPTQSPSPSATLTSEPTVAPVPILLPLLLHEACQPETRHADVALVLDTSSSMLDPTANGGSKLAAALTAAGVFLDQLHLAADGDQAAIVTFDHGATVAQPLTPDRAALDAALAKISTDRQTCISCGIDAAATELAGPRHRQGNVPVLVLLTDGRANPETAEEGVRRAALAKAAGLTLFTIGLGNDVDLDALAAIASRPDYFHHAPDAADLEGIYRTVAGTIPCPSAAFWGRR
ncbi:MAG: VWA domain-containing protein [Anaerolineae bacterium]